MKVVAFIKVKRNHRNQKAVIEINHSKDKKCNEKLVCFLEVTTLKALCDTKPAKIKPRVER